MKNVSQSAVVIFLGALLFVIGVISYDSKVGPWVLGSGVAAFVIGVIMLATGKGRKNI